MPVIDRRTNAVRLDIAAGTRFVAGLAALFCVAAGCSPSDQPPLAPVRGVVTLDGKPLAGKHVIFRPESGRASIGVIQDDGAYELQYTMQIKGAIIGNHTVSVETPFDPDRPGWKETVPKQFSRDSTLTADVKNTKNKIDFALKSE